MKQYITLQDKQLKREKQEQREELVMKIVLLVVAIYFASRLLLGF